MHTTYRRLLIVGLLTMLLLAACGNTEQEQAPHSANTTETTMEHTAVPVRQANTETPPLPFALNPAQGQEIGTVYEAYLAPQQEPGEEKDTPSHIPTQFRSTAPSLLRDERPARGHALLRFTKDLSRVYIDVQVADLDPTTVVMFHIHCGRPDMLGPILVDFSVMDDIQANLADGVYSIEVTNADIEATTASASGMVGALTMGCPIPPSLAVELGSVEKVKTIAGMEYIARQGELYFNLHTSGQVYFGDMRGQIYPLARE